MEVVKEKRGRAAAGKQEARPVAVRRRTDHMLADGWPRGAAEWALAVLMALTLTGVVPMALAELLIWLLDPVPSWAVLSGFAALMLGGAAWVWRAL